MERHKRVYSVLTVFYEAFKFKFLSQLIYYYLNELKQRMEHWPMK
jgi:hypothetical protein